MPTIEALQQVLLSATGSREPDPRLLKQLPADHAALRLLRDSRSAVAGIPARIGPWRRDRLLAWDADRTAWDGWDVEAGCRVLICAARADTWGRPLPGHGLALRNGWPAFVSPPFQHSLADLLPSGSDTDAGAYADPDRLSQDIDQGSAPGDPRWAGQIAAALLGDLQRSHAAGHVHGHVCPEFLIFAGRWLLWDPLLRSGSGAPLPPERDLTDLGRVLLALDPRGFVGDLGGVFIDDPPPSVPDAARLLQRAMGEHLAAAHHRITRRARGLSSIGRRDQLLGVAGRLHRLVPPPEGIGCVQAGQAGSFYLLVSDGRTVRGGPTASFDLRLLPIIAGPDQFDSHAFREIYRAWKTHRRGNEPLRAQIQAALQSSDAEIVLIFRWLFAFGTLHAEIVNITAPREP